ncbi:MAG: hypothetical protein AB1758_35455, partial [Candidatus Eremiobacterota bacterium]
RMAPSLMPVLKSWETREREQYLMSAAHAFGPRLRDWPEMLDLLQRLVGTTRSLYIASQALQLLRREAPARLHRLIPGLLAQDESWAMLAPVHSFLHMSRQDLLTPFLGHRVLKGRFSTGRTVFVLPVFEGFHRWTPRQHGLFHQTLRSLVSDAVRDTPTLRQAMQQLAALPGACQTLVEQARLDHPRPAIRDLALRALARRDEGDGLPTLLQALADDRARIAVYALRRALREARPQDALQLLRDVPTAKVTVAKEVIRLLGELPADLAYGELLRLAGTNLHRDARVALLRALWDHLEDERTWPLLEEAAVSEDPALAAGVIRIPADRVSAASRARLVALLARLLRHPDPRVRLDTQNRLGSLPLADPDRLLLDRLVDALGAAASDERSAAADALFGVYGSAGLEVLEQAAARLLPDRRALVSLCNRLIYQSGVSFTRSASVAASVLKSLGADPLTLGLQAQLATACLTPEELQAWLQGQSFDFDSLAHAVWWVSQKRPRLAAEELEGLEGALGMSPRPELRRLGLAALVASAAGPTGWTEARRARLDSYRADPEPMIRAPAEFTFPPD